MARRLERTIQAAALACAVAAASAAFAAGPPVRPRTGRLEAGFDALAAALERDDRGAVERATARLGYARLVDALVLGRRGNSPAPRETKLVLQALGVVYGAVRLLPHVVPLVEADGETATLAARALGVLLDGAEPTALADWDVPPDAVRAACAALVRQSLATARPTSVREAALEALAGSPYCPNPSARLLQDPSPVVRRAAALALPAGQRTGARELRGLLRDRETLVACAAAARLCGATGRTGPDAELAKAVRALAAWPTAPAEDIIEMLGCVNRASDPADRYLLEHLKDAASPAVRRKATELLATPEGA